MAGGSEAAELLPPGSVWPDLVDSRVSWPDSSDIGSGVMPDTLRDSRYAPILAPLGRVPYLCAAFFRFLSSNCPTLCLSLSALLLRGLSPSPPRLLLLLPGGLLPSPPRPARAGAPFLKEDKFCEDELYLSSPTESSSSSSTSPLSPSLSARWPPAARLSRSRLMPSKMCSMLPVAGSRPSSPSV